MGGNVSKRPRIVNNTIGKNLLEGAAMLIHEIFLPHLNVYGKKFKPFSSYMLLSPGQ